MKIALSVGEPSLDGIIDPRFGRCPYYLFVETDDMSFDTMENPNVELSGGAGIQSAQFMSQQGVKVLLTGNCGPNASKAMDAAGVKVITGCSGVARNVVESFKAGALTADPTPNAGGNYNMDNVNAPPVMDNGPNRFTPPTGGTGMGSGMGGGGGRGMGGGGCRRTGGGGRGMGGGGGRGMGGGGGRGMGGGGGRGMGGGGGRGMGGGGR